jgi:hypothetical protein
MDFSGGGQSRREPRAVVTSHFHTALPDHGAQIASGTSTAYAAFLPVSAQPGSRAPRLRIGKAQRRPRRRLRDF